MSELQTFLETYRGRLDVSAKDRKTITVLAHLPRLSFNAHASTAEAALEAAIAKLSSSAKVIGAHLRVDLQARRSKIAKAEAADRKPNEIDVEAVAELERLLELIDPAPKVVGKCFDCGLILRGRAWKSADGKSTRFEADVYEIDGDKLICARCVAARAQAEDGVAELELVSPAEE